MKPSFSHLERYRVQIPTHLSRKGDQFGVFMINGEGKVLRIISTPGNTEHPWEHVSVSVVSVYGASGTRIPFWGEMCQVKDLFWNGDETVVQYHPPKSDYVNCHPHTLHLWKPWGAELPRPPKVMV